MQNSAKTEIVQIWKCSVKVYNIKYNHKDFNNLWFMTTLNKIYLTLFMRKPSNRFMSPVKISMTNTFAFEGRFII